MHREVRFSVLIPLYNAESYIEECISSVLNQSFQDFEIIVIDDGSTDFGGSKVELLALKDSRIRLFHQENSGLIFTRTRAINVASGIYCLFLDSDDYWEPNLLETVNGYFERNNADLIIFRLRQVTKFGEIINSMPPLFIDESIFDNSNKYLLLDHLFSGSQLNNVCCKAVKRDFIDTLEYVNNKKIKNAEDLLLTIPMIFRANKIVYSDKLLYNYRMLNTSMTHSFNENYFSDITTVRTILGKYLIKYNLNSKMNIIKFYQFYLVSILNYTNVLAQTKISRSKKIRILKEIRSFDLYDESIKYSNLLNFSFDQRVTKWLINRRLIATLYLYKSFVNIIRIIRNFKLRSIRKENEK